MITITGRSMQIPHADRIVGWSGDNFVEVKVFELSRTYGDIDMADFDFKLDTQVGVTKNIIDLPKTIITTNNITLTWAVAESHVTIPGRMSIQIRAFSGAEEKWHSAQDYVFVQSSINATDVIPDPLPSEFEQMEVRVTAAKNEAEVQADRAQDIADTLENITVPAAITAIESAGQAKVDLAMEQAEIATTKAREASDSASEAEATLAARYTMTQADAIYASLLDGTLAQYRRVMRAWFIANGCDDLDDLSDLMQRWYEITRTGWTGGVHFDDASISDLSTGTRLGDNIGLSCTPSTDTVAGTDDYANIPLFIPTDVNWRYDDDGELVVTAIDGISDGFDRYTLGKHVGVAQMAGFRRIVVDSDGTTIMYSDSQQAGYSPLPEAVKLDGTLRSFVVHSKYLMGDDLGCYSGVAPRGWSVSHNSCITLLREKWGTHYGAGTSADDAWMKLMWWLKYATWTMDGILDGCCDYNYQYTAAAAESGVERILIQPAQGANLIVGSTVIVGVANVSGIDRAYAEMWSIVNRKKIKSIESVIVGGNTYAAINIDNGGISFDVTTATYISTMPWYAGSCDRVLGNDGSPGAPAGGKYPCKLQGIEFRTGQYEVRGDTILEGYEEGLEKRMRGAVCRKASLYATSITANYRRANYYVLRPAASAWTFLTELGFDSALPELIIAKTTGGSSSTYMRDAWYLGNTAGTFTREWLACAYLANGVAGAGLSAANANFGLGDRHWYVGARLGATGNRGELAA